MPRGIYPRKGKKKSEKKEKVVKKKEIEEENTEKIPKVTFQNKEDVPVPSEEIPAPEKDGVKDEKVCANCDIDCEGKGQAKWHYGSKDKWCNKCKCLALKQ